MAWKRTGQIQTEKTATGVITTAEERDTKTKARRWVQIGYTSIIQVQRDSKWVEVLDGPIGHALNNSTEQSEQIIGE